MDFTVIDPQLITYSAFVTTREGIGVQLFMDFRKVCASDEKLIRLIKMSLNETYSEVCIGKH